MHVFGAVENISSWLKTYIATNTAPVRAIFYVTELDAVAELKRVGVAVTTEDHSKTPIKVEGIAPVSVIKGLIGKPYIVNMEGAPKVSAPTSIVPVSGGTTPVPLQTGFDWDKFWTNNQWYILGGTGLLVVGIIIWKVFKNKKVE